MGPLLCLLSAAGFGGMAVFAKLAYQGGVSVDALLLVRFGIASLVLIVIAAGRGAFRRVSRGSVVAALLMGGVGYAMQATFYFTALQRIDASLVAMIFYIYPVLVMAVAILVSREQASVRRMGALGVALTGIALVMLGTSTGQLDAVGALLALGAAVSYTGYIMIGDIVTRQIPPLPLAALVCTGAFGSFLVAGFVRGGTDLSFESSAWLWLTALSLISTVGAILLFFAGLGRVGPSTAALLSSFEPVVTVVAAGAVFGEGLTGTQWIGGALVLAAVLLAQVPNRPITDTFRSRGFYRAIPFLDRPAQHDVPTPLAEGEQQASLLVRS